MNDLWWTITSDNTNTVTQMPSGTTGPAVPDTGVGPGQANPAPQIWTSPNTTWDQFVANQFIIDEDASISEHNGQHSIKFNNREKFLKVVKGMLTSKDKETQKFARKILEAASVSPLDIIKGK